VRLEEIKRHPYYPFRDFRTNDLSFLLLELYWAELFQTIVSSHDPKKQIHTPWNPKSAADRNDGNPIFHVINRTLAPSRVLRIIQRFNTEKLPEFDPDHPVPVRFKQDAYVPFVPGLTFGATDDDGTTPIEELVISSDISNACERLNRQMITNWCVEAISAVEMQKSINNYWSFVRGYLIETSST
jgi:hypothetical protein